MEDSQEEEEEEEESEIQYIHNKFWILTWMGWLIQSHHLC
jgi:hypothetical protein